MASRGSTCVPIPAATHAHGGCTLSGGCPRRHTSLTATNTAATKLISALATTCACCWLQDANWWPPPCLASKHVDHAATPTAMGTVWHCAHHVHHPPACLASRQPLPAHRVCTAAALFGYGYNTIASSCNERSPPRHINKARPCDGSKQKG